MKKTALFALLSVPLCAATQYVRDGGTSSACTSWTDACDQITTAHTNASRGDTIWVADGSYNGVTLDKAESGTTRITIKKATAAAHGTETGWLSTYGDGQATIGDVLVQSDYYTVDGATRNESNWESGSDYGFHVTAVAASTSFGPVGHNLILQYVDVGGAEGTAFTGSEPTEGIYIGGFTETVTGWTISRCRVHNVKLPFQLAGASGFTIEYTAMGPAWSKETIRGQVVAASLIIRYNYMHDACQGVPGEPGAEGCTGQIAIWDGSNFNGNQIYGNVIWTTKSTHHSDACILVGSTITPPTASNTVIYNNTLVGVASGQCSLSAPAGTSNVIRNNIWYNLGVGVGTGCSANTCSDNEVVSNIFVNAATGNFRLSQATTAGFSLSSPYNADMDGVTRGSDGTWDRGAFEFDSTPAGTPTQRMRGTARVSTGTVR
jgi:hypothetical protein